MRANGGVQMFVLCSVVFSRLLLLSYFCEWSWESILCFLGLVSVSDYRMWRKKFNRRMDSRSRAAVCSPAPPGGRSVKALESGLYIIKCSNYFIKYKYFNKNARNIYLHHERVEFVKAAAGFSVKAVPLKENVQVVILKQRTIRTTQT